MAVAFTSLAAASTSTSNTTSYAGTAGTPSSGDLLICCALVSDTVAIATMTGVWTWQLLTSFTKNGGLDTFYIFWARATAATSTTPTVDVTGDAGTGAVLHCWRVTGQEGGGAPYIRQWKTATGTAANPAVTMDTAILTGNGCISFVGNGTNSAAQYTAPTGWAAAVANAFNTPPNGFASSSRASGETGTTITCTNANTTAWGLIVMEFYVAGTGPVADSSAAGCYGGITSI